MRSGSPSKRVQCFAKHVGQTNKVGTKNKRPICIQLARKHPSPSRTMM